MLLLLSHILIARVYGAHAFGSFVIALGVMRGINVLISSGYTNLFIKYNLAFHTNETFRKYVYKTFGKWLITLSIIGVIALGVWQPNLEAFAKLNALPIPMEVLLGFGFLLAVLMLFRAYLIGKKQVILGLSVKEIIFNLLFILFLLLGTLVIPDDQGIYYAYGLALGGSILTGFFFERRKGGPITEVPFGEQERKKVRQFILFVYINGLFQYLYSWIDTLLVGAMISPLEAGHYRAAYQLAQVFYLLKMALNQIIGPHITELNLQRKYQEMAHYYRFAVWGMFYLILPLVCVLVPFGDRILSFFGSSFTVAYLPLILLLGGQLISILVGPAGIFLILLGAERLALVNIIITALLNIFLNVILIPRYGILGAAIASSLSLTVVMLFRVVEVNRLYKLQPISWDLVYSFAGGAVYTLLLLYLQHIESWGVLLVATIGALFVYLKFGLATWNKTWKTT